MKFINSIRIFAAGLALAGGASAATITFTNAGASGVAGPNQALVDAAYVGTNLEGMVTVFGLGIQRWTVQQSGVYNITAAGASGGSTTTATGGSGALITMQTSLSAGDTLDILVGQVGGYASFGGYSGGEAGGGGGGTFIVGAGNTPLLVAGGGGGASQGGYNGGFAVNGVNASVYSNTSGQNGTSIPASWSLVGLGGSAGNGGTKPGYGGSAGGGFYTNGQGDSYYAGSGGAAYVNGGSGGINIDYSGGFIQNIGGGFGGGAGAGVHSSYEANAGGGGGYSGGGGSNSRAGAGGGGGNYYAGDFVSAGSNAGHGFVSFELVSGVSAPDGGSTALMIGAFLAGLVSLKRRLR